MSNHTGTMCACQYPAHDPRPQTPPPPVSSVSPAAATGEIDRRLVQRYGAPLLGGGYTALPTYAYVYYARLGVTEAELVFIAQLCTYWWSTRDPYPGEEALAARMGKTVRTIQGYIRSLGEKGLLHIHTRYSDHGRQHTNRYDVRPFFAAVEGLARLDGLLDDAHTSDDADVSACPSPPPTRPAAPPPTMPAGPLEPPAKNAHPTWPTTPPNTGREGAEQNSLCAVAARGGAGNSATVAGVPTAREGEESCAGGVKNSSPQVNPIETDHFDLDSIPPTPINTSLDVTYQDDELRSTDEADQALATVVAALSAELGDDAPRSSRGRARNLCRVASVPRDRFLGLLDEAAARTRDRQASIVKRRRDGQAPNGMPYLFAVLQDLLHPAPPPVADVGPDRRRAERPGRRRRRAGGRGEPAGSYAAWSDSPAPLPIVEEHPVWRVVLDELAQVLTPENFNAWFATTRALDQDGALLRVAVPAAFNKTWLEQKLCGKVAGALHKIDYGALGTGCVARVEYVVAAAA